MEKLQAAIEKARAQREAARAEAPVVDQLAGDTDGAGTSGSPATAEDRDLWAALPELTPDPRRLRRKRVFIDGNGAEATYFDRLRTKILQLCRDNGWTRVVITSPTQSCGKTTVCANLLASFARQKDRKVIALDMDMRRPSLGSVLGIADRIDLAEVFEDRGAFEGAAVRIGQNVIIAANRGPHRNPSQIILQDRTKQLLDEIQSRYAPDLILFDTPPLFSVDDTSALLKHVDCAIVIAGAEMSTVEQVDLCEKEIAEQTNVLGVVLNRCNYLDDTESYGYGY